MAKCRDRADEGHLRRSRSKLETAPVRRITARHIGTNCHLTVRPAALASQPSEAKLAEKVARGIRAATEQPRYEVEEYKRASLAAEEEWARSQLERYRCVGTDDAGRRYHTPHSRPHRLHHRGADHARSRPSSTRGLSADRRTPVPIPSDERGDRGETTSAEHREWANQLYATYSRGREARLMAAIVGESGLGDADRRALELALASHGYEELRATGWPPRDLAVEIEPGQVWGIPISQIPDKPPPVQRTLQARATAPGSAGPASIEAARRFEVLTDLLLDAAPREMRLRRLGAALSKTSRQLHRLEQRVGPRLQGEISRVKRALDEREREEHQRLKHIQRRLRRAASA